MKGSFIVNRFFRNNGPKGQMIRNYLPQWLFWKTYNKKKTHFSETENIFIIVAYLKHKLLALLFYLDISVAFTKRNEFTCSREKTTIK